MKIRRILSPATIICVVICVVALVYGRPVGMVLYTKWQVRNASELWIVPIPLPVTAPEKSDGKSFSYFGYQFESPWTEVKRERKLESLAVLNFSNGNMITILEHKKGNSPFEVMKQAGAQRASNITNIFGDEAIRSNYALRSKIFYLTPRDLRLSWSRQEMVGNAVLLILKQIWVPRMNTGLYSFQTEWFRGFQSGDPARVNVVIIEAFDRQDREVELWIGSEKQANNKPSQEDINRVLYSLHPI